MIVSKRWRAALTVAAAGGGLTAMLALGAAPALADTPVTSPQAYAGQNWCPTFHGDIGCSGVQTPTQLGQPLFNSNFDPAQDGISANGYFNMHMVDNSGVISAGAFNSQTQFTVAYGNDITEKLNLACNAAGTKIAGWPAFWTDATTGTFPQGGEIDIAEGLNGAVHYGIHFQNAGGTEGSIGGTYPGGPLCGVHTYGVIWSGTGSTAKVAFYLDGTWIDKVTSADMGVPMFTDAQNVINDYGSGSDGGPDVFGSIDQVQAYSTTSIGPLVKGAGLSAFIHAKRGNYALAG
jgi:hypothetical protein